MKYNLDLFVRIAIVGIIASAIQMFILLQIAVNYGLFSIYIMFPSTVLVAGIGFIVFTLMRNTGLAKFLNKKNVNIFCIIFAAIIILPAIIEYDRVVPPEEITNSWVCNRGQELCNKIDGMNIVFDRTVGFKHGEFLKNWACIGRGSFSWDYDKSSKEITLYQSDWKIKLRLEITGDKMTTYYISSSGKPVTYFNSNRDLTDTEWTETDIKLFDGVTWTARDDY